MSRKIENPKMRAKPTIFLPIVWAAMAILASSGWAAPGETRPSPKWVPVPTPKPETPELKVLLPAARDVNAPGGGILRLPSARCYSHHKGLIISG